MTTNRRLDHLEEGLSPKEGTLLWLREAHEHGSLPAYCAWLSSRPLAEAPLVRLHDQALTAVRRVMRGEPLEGHYAAEVQADRDVAFLFELVMGLESAADETCRLESLRYRMIFWEGRAISAEGRQPEHVRPDGPRPTIGQRWTDWRAAKSALCTDFAVQAEARRRLEVRYLDGHIALFP